MKTRSFAFASILLIAVFAAACGGTTKPGSTPTSPTSATTVASPTPSGGTNTGVIIDLTTETPVGTVGAGTVKPVVGKVSGLAGSCPNVTLTLAGVPVQVTSATTFDGGNCEALANGVMAGAIGVRNANGVVVAARMKVGGIAPPPKPMPLMGTISGLTGTCPDITFTLQGAVVKTVATTRFEGAACGDLKDGTKAAVVGAKRSDGSLTAEVIRAMVPPPPGTVFMKGAVATVTGDCPALTVTLKTPMMSAVVIQVLFTATTQISGGTCTDIKPDVYLAIEGLKKDGPVIEAQKVRIETTPPPVVTFSGTIGNFAGTCPDTTFKVSIPNTMAPAMNVTTDAKTRYDGGTCQTLGNDVKVAVAVIRNTTTTGAMRAVGIKFVK